jgi:pimeloyl-ACP methyl ester carboxylesterase
MTIRCFPLWPLALLGFVTMGCTASRQEVRRSPECPPTPVRGVVFVANGAGGFRATSEAFRQALGEKGVPLAVETVAWSHGYGRVLADQIDQRHAQAEGHCLAVRVAAYRQSHPTDEIYLVGHSAGSAVVLAAAESLPHDTVDQMILLSPSVSAEYDVRQALRTCRKGVDVFFSTRDVAFLGVAVGLVGTTDRHWSAPAGRVGFHPQPAAPEDMVLVAKLRQHPWHPCLAWSGNHGGHRGSYHVGYLKAYVLPLLTDGSPSLSP